MEYKDYIKKEDSWWQGALYNVGALAAFTITILLGNNSSLSCIVVICLLLSMILHFLMSYHYFKKGYSLLKKRSK